MNIVRVSQRHLTEFRDMWLAKGWGCAVCGQPFTAKDGAVVDHSHKTGIIRGCLHNTCNRLEGELLSLANKMSKGQGEAWLIQLGKEIHAGKRPSKVITNIARYSHKGVKVEDYIIGLSVYLNYHQTPRCRMIHPSHRFPNEGGNVHRKNPRFKKWKTSTKKR